MPLFLYLVLHIAVAAIPQPALMRTHSLSPVPRLDKTDQHNNIDEKIGNIPTCFVAWVDMRSPSSPSSRTNLFNATAIPHATN